MRTRSLHWGPAFRRAKRSRVGEKQHVTEADGDGLSSEDAASREAATLHREAATEPRGSKGTMPSPDRDAPAAHSTLLFLCSQAAPGTITVLWMKILRLR